MSIFDYPIFLCFLIFIIWFAYERKKSDKINEARNKDFWKRESEANFSRRKNLDAIKYIAIPYEAFPIEKYHEDDILTAERLLLSLKDKRILNLTGKTSTDLKLEYGVANLPLLDEYDENYISMVKALQQYAEALYNPGYTDDAKTVLEFAVSAGTDLKSSYILLADIYSSCGTPEKIQELIVTAETLDSLMKTPIINALKNYTGVENI